MRIEKTNEILRVIIEHEGLYEDDTFAVLLSDDKLINENDFVFYNSYNRSTKYERGSFRSRIDWKHSTFPISNDNAVMIKDACSTESVCDECIIDLGSIDSRINKIVVGACLYGTCFQEEHINSFIQVRVFISNDQKNICEFQIPIDESAVSKRAFEGLILKRSDDRSWEINKGTLFFSNGLEDVIEKYGSDF